MGQGANILFNFIAAIFLVLTVVVAVVTLSVAANAMEPPFLKPEPTLVPATPYVPPTLIPSATPGPSLTPTIAAQ
jgi:hypothetical protein